MAKRRRKSRKSPRRRNHRRKRPVSMVVQGNLLKLSLRTTTFRRGGGTRRGISRFTRASRKRMLEDIARLDWKLAGFVCFVTLTYPDREGPPSAAETERDRQVFFKRMKRLFPQSSAIWRREWVPRESGKFVGTLYPHYHSLFFGLPFFHYDRLNALWGEVLGYDEYVRTEIKQVKSWLEALGYVAKYMAKLEPGPSAAQGAIRREADAPAAAGAAPGAGECLREADDVSGAGSLVYVAYLTAGDGTSDGVGAMAGSMVDADREFASRDWDAVKKKRRDETRRRDLEKLRRKRQGSLREELPRVDEKPETESIGRSWGRHNEQRLPWAKRRSCSVRAGLWLELAKRRARREWPGIDYLEGTGFTLFSEQADKLFDEILALRLPGPR